MKFHVFNKKKFDSIPLKFNDKDIEEVIDEMSNNLDNPDIYLDGSHYVALTESSEDYSYQDIVDKLYEVEGYLISLGNNVNKISSHDRKEVLQLYQMYKSSVFFKSIWFIKPSLKFERKYLSYVLFDNFDENAFKLQNSKNSFGVECDSEVAQDYLNGLLILNWEEDAPNILIQNFYFHKMIKGCSEQKYKVFME